MVEQPVILGFVPTSVTSLGGSAWSVTAAVDDPLEIHDGWAIARGDVLFLDLRDSVSAPGTAGRYTVASIVGKGSKVVSVVLEWDAAGAPVSPIECLNVRGYLAQPVDVVGTVAHPRQQTILLEQAFIDLARHVEQYAIGTESEESEQVRTFRAEEEVEAGKFVTVMPSGNIVLSVPQDMSRMPASGIALTSGEGLIRVRVGGITPRVAAGLLPGAPVFVGDGGLPVTDPQGITLPAAVQLVGTALDTSSIALAITGSVVKRM